MDKSAIANFSEEELHLLVGELQPIIGNFVDELVEEYFKHKGGLSLPFIGAWMGKRVAGFYSETPYQAELFMKRRFFSMYGIWECSKVEYYKLFKAGVDNPYSAYALPIVIRDFISNSLLIPDFYVNVDSKLYKYVVVDGWGNDLNTPVYWWSSLKAKEGFERQAICEYLRLCLVVD